MTRLSLGGIRSLPVLLYHSISHASSCAVSPEIFAEHCAVIARAGWRALSLSEAESYFLEKTELPPKSCLISFDDGYLDNWLTAAPLLEKHNLKGVIFPVLELLEKNAAPRRKEECGPERETLVFRKGQLTLERRFCSEAELREMARRGVLTPAPHSLRHDRMAASPKFRGLTRPDRERGWFTMPAYGVVWGMPAFPLRHALSGRAFLPSDDLLHLVRSTVPQQWNEAKEWLDAKTNRENLLREIRLLESRKLMGHMENEEEYRARLFDEFTACRDRFAALFGTSPVSFCWPWGHYNATALEEARKAGFRLFFTTVLGANRPDDSLHVHRFRVGNISGRMLLWEMTALALSPLAALAGAWQRGKNAPERRKTL
jgi:peptidoglycan/xylan/chitin deacetylase (PgdA/CDA1 family)